MVTLGSERSRILGLWLCLTVLVAMSPGADKQTGYGPMANQRQVPDCRARES